MLTVEDASSVFAFRRGEHFMAPGWMTNGSVYNKVIRPTWFDLHGELLPWARSVYIMGTGIPIWIIESKVWSASIHPFHRRRGAVGYTVRKDRQDAVLEA